MPDKDGDDEKKSTKSVVNKKQKQMMGEEGYDIERDMGKVRPSKDKKDATTMPPSKEMKKTQKVNKGPSALELVKKKYKGQIMDVKKEELDLTQVAEAFGGYIIEKKTPEELEQTRRERRKIEKKIIKSPEAQVKDELATRQQVALLKKQDYGKYNTKQNKKKVEITYGKYDTRRDKVTGDVEPEPKKIKKPIRDRNRVLQRVRIAARTAKRPVQRLVKPTPGLLAKAGKVAVKNPFATLVGASFAKDTFFPMKLPRPPVVRGGKVGRRTAG